MQLLFNPGHTSYVPMFTQSIQCYIFIKQTHLSKSHKESFQLSVCFHTANKEKCQPFCCTINKNNEVLLFYCSLFFSNTHRSSLCLTNLKLYKPYKHRAIKHTNQSIKQSRSLTSNWATDALLKGNPKSWLLNKWKYVNIVSAREGSFERKTITDPPIQ